MKALFLESPGQYPRFDVKEIPLPRIESDEILIKVQACGFCYHDRLIISGQLKRGVTFPLVLGHEISGLVVKRGCHVKDLTPGDRVVCLPTDACGLCENCGKNKTNQCNKGIALGHNAQGGLAEFVKVRAFSAIKIPDNIGWNQAAILACPIGVGLEALSLVKVPKTKQIAVITGAGGGLGIHLVQLAKMKGFRVIAITSDDRKEPIILEMGADQVVVNEEIGFSEIINAITSDEGTDLILDTVGSPLWPQTFRSLSKRGLLIILGEVTGEEIRLNLAELIFRGATITGHVGVSKNSVVESVHLVHEKKINPVVWKTFPMENILDASKSLETHNHLGRIVLTPNWI